MKQTLDVYLHGDLVGKLVQDDSLMRSAECGMRSGGRVVQVKVKV